MKKWQFILTLLFTSALLPSPVLPTEHKKVVLVLGSGGSKGLAHIGVIEELENLGVMPDVVVGCSAGAIIGALYAQHQDIGKVKEILIDMKYEDLADFSLFEKYAISSRKKLENFLKEHLTATDFCSLNIPFIAVATDLSKGEPVYFQEGELHSAVLASAALPVLFPPYKREGLLYVDGGVSDPLPVSFARSLEEAVVIASDISPLLDGFNTDSLVAVLRKSFEIIYQRLAYWARGEADVLLEMNFKEIDSPIDDSANHQIYERGREEVQKNAQEILKAVSKN